MYEVENLKDVNGLLDEYRELYRRKYGYDPIIQNQAHANTTFKDLARKVGTAMTRRLLELYMSTDGDNGWYKRHGHNLVVFQKNIEALHSQLGLKGRREGGHSGPSLKLALKSWCPKCNQDFILVTTKPDDCGVTLCEKCH